MCKIKNLIAGGIAFSLAISVNAQNSEDAPAAQKKVTAPPVVQKAAVQNVPANDPMSASSTGPNMNRPVQPPVNKQTVEDKTQPAKPVVAEQVIVEAKAPAKETVTPFSGGAASKPTPVVEQAISVKGTSMDPDAMPVQAVPAKPAGRTPAEIEKAKQPTEQNKVQPAVGKDVAAAQSAKLPEIKVVQADGDPLASKAAEVKPPVAPSSDGKQELPAKKN